MTDVELDARITALEETGGADPSNGKYCLYIIARVQYSITQLFRHVVVRILFKLTN